MKAPLEISGQQAAEGKCQEMGQAFAEIREKLDYEVILTDPAKAQLDHAVFKPVFLSFLNCFNQVLFPE